MKTEWDLKDLEVNFNEERKNYQSETEKFASKWKNRKDYLEKPEILKEALEEYEKLLTDYQETNEEAYYWLKEKKDSGDTDVTSKFRGVEKFSQKMNDEIRFFGLKVAKISKKNQTKFLGYPGLNEYKHYLEGSFNEAKYLLSEKEEKIIDLKSRSAHSAWEDMTDKLLLSEERKTLLEDGSYGKKTYPDLLNLMKSKNKKVRENAKMNFEYILDRHGISVEAEINAILRNKEIDDELRGFKRPDSERHLDDDLESEVVDALIKSVTKRFEISHKYYELKSKLLGVPKLDYSERAMNYGEIKSDYNYENSVKLVKKVLGNLDSEFGEIFSNFVETGKIDAFPKKGKDGGAFCVHFTKNKPVYILLNHAGSLDDVTTIAHETGHGINNELMKKQNSLNFGTPLSTAEVASTFMEDFVLEELTKEARDEEKLAILMEKLDRDISTIQRQVAFYNFEKELHKTFREKSYLSKEEIGELFKSNLSKYMGSSVDCSKADNWWMYVGHFRRPFYVYSYASGLLISKTMQEKVKENPEFVGKVKDFLSSGESKSPKKLFLDMGIDITKEDFWNKGLDGLEKILVQTEALAKKLGKI
ncbi:MAG: M3 family oligoendopeptidase [archaeon]|nr:M3 family oligoendopeptidase [archaeon]